MRFVAIRFVLPLLSVPVLLATGQPEAGAATATRQETEIRQLRQRAEQIQRNLHEDQANRDSARTALERSERAIAALVRELAQTRTDLGNRRRELRRLEQTVTAERRRIQANREHLAQLMRASYQTGPYEPFKLLFNQQDPAQFSRMFDYYGYLARFRAGRMTDLRNSLSRLSDAQTRLKTEQAELERAAAAQKQRRDRLQTAQRKRAALVAALEERIASGGAELDRVNRDISRLQKLLDQLRSKANIVQGPAGGFDAMRGRLPLPVDAPISARFGQPRAVPGSYWQGLFFQAAAGTPVRAVYPGRVVFADWLRGFGLLLIIDHGQDYMSLYSHNQILEKRVGDSVAAGETIGLVGDSGGMPRAGLYFEVRHRGTPRDPLLWCASH